jgi:3-deoxy-D-manno-octulosonate 8-phosphate phosphatase KdsC-like HAD superfamily phosphatase
MTVNANMAYQRRLPLSDSRFYSKTLDKSQVINHWLQAYKIEKHEIAFIGDDYYDLSMVESLDWTFCPADAATIIKRRVKQVIPRNGGDGVIEWLFDDLHSKGLVTGAFPYE